MTRGEFLAAGVKERAEEMGISLNTEELTRVVRLDDMEIRVEMVEFRQRCTSSKNVKLAELLKIEEPVAQDSMLLLSCQRELTNIRNRYSNQRICHPVFRAWLDDHVIPWRLGIGNLFSRDASFLLLSIQRHSKTSWS